MNFARTTSPVSSVDITPWNFSGWSRSWPSSGSAAISSPIRLMIFFTLMSSVS